MIIITELDTGKAMAVTVDTLNKRIKELEGIIKKKDKLIPCTKPGCKGCQFLHRDERIAKEKTRNVCKHWAAGKCKFGDNCYYLHDQKDKGLLSAANVDNEAGLGGADATSGGAVGGGKGGGAVDTANRVTGGEIDGLNDGSVRPRTIPASIATLPEPVPTIDPNGNGPRRGRSNSNDRRRRFNVNDVRVRSRSKSRSRSRSAVKGKQDDVEKMDVDGGVASLKRQGTASTVSWAASVDEEERMRLSRAERVRQLQSSDAPRKWGMGNGSGLGQGANRGQSSKAPKGPILKNKDQLEMEVEVNMKDAKLGSLEESSMVGDVRSSLTMMLKKNLNLEKRIAEDQEKLKRNKEVAERTEKYLGSSGR